MSNLEIDLPSIQLKAYNFYNLFFVKFDKSRCHITIPHQSKIRFAIDKNN